MLGRKKQKLDSEIVIERVGEADFDTYEELRRDALDNAPNAFVSSREEIEHEPREAGLTYIKDNVVLGAWQTTDRGRELVGTVAMALLPCRLRHMCELARMYVSPTVRGKGVGDALIEAFTRNMDELGLEACKLSVVAKNKPAVRLYRRHGFRVYGSLKNEFHASYGKVTGLHMVKWRKPQNG